MNATSDTPRTDAVEWTCAKGTDDRTVVWSDFCRTIERELNEQVLCNGKGGEREADLLGKVGRLERERDALAWKVKLLRDVLDRIDPLERYTRDDGKRDWATAGCWLHRGEAIANIDYEKCSAALSATAPKEDHP